MKICKKCKTPKEVSEFNKRKASKDRLNSWCKECTKIDNHSRKGKYNHKYYEYRKRYEAKPEIKQRIKDNYQKNKKSIRDRTGIYYWTLNGQLKCYLKSARYRNLEFLLKKEEYSKFFNTNCFYCNKEYRGLGIDRVDNNKGYITGNCVSCCKDCNTMKMRLTLEQFKNQIINIYNNLNLWEHIKK